LFIKKDELLAPLIQSQKQMAEELSSIEAQLQQIALKKK
jgi:hypothetical protein